MKVNSRRTATWTLLLSLPLAAAAAQRRVIIDTDPGVDDAIALLMAMRSPDLKIEAITPVAGNVGLDLTLPNALRLVEIADRSDIPVAAGARQPLLRKLVTASYAHGDNGLAGVVLPEPKIKPVATPAAQLIREIVHKYPHEVSLITIGPLTNVAQAFRDDPELPGLIDEIVMMGGSLSGGNVTPAAEFNFYVDPEAARIVFHSGAKLTMVGLDPLREGGLTAEDIQKLAASNKKVAQAAAKFLTPGMERMRARGINGPRGLPDPAAMSAFLDRSLFQYAQVYIDVETSGELTAGMTVAYRGAPLRRSAPSLGLPDNNFLVGETFKPNCAAAIHVDGPRWEKFMMDLLSR
jgi:inosine-uridine nucleoside N-ribohydrolase